MLAVQVWLTEAARKLPRNRVWVATAPALMAAALLAVMIARFNTVPVLVGLFGLGLVAVLAFVPAIAVYFAAILIYANIPAAFRAEYPATEPLAAAFFGFLTIACARRYLFDGRVNFDRTLMLMLLLGLVMLVASFGAVNRQAALTRIAQFAVEGVLLYWLLLQTIQTRRVLRGVVWAVVATAAFLASLSIYQQVTGDYRQQFGGLADRQLRHEIAAASSGQLRAGTRPSAGVRVSERAAGPVSDPNRHAQNLLVALPLAIYLVRRRPGLVRKFWPALLTSAIAAGVVLTYSRGAFVAVGVLILAAGFWRIVRRARLFAGLVVAVLLVTILAPTYVTRIATIVNSVALLNEETRSDPDGAIRGRATEMLAAFSAFRDHPVLGVGPGQYTPYYSQEYQQRSDIQFRALRTPREPHDLFIAIAAETGAIGLIVFVGLVALLAGDLLRARRALFNVDRDLARLLTACLFGVVVYLGCGLFLHLAYERYFWFLLGLSGAALLIAKREYGHAV